VAERHSHYCYQSTHSLLNQRYGSASVETMETQPSSLTRQHYYINQMMIHIHVHRVDCMRTLSMVVLVINVDTFREYGYLMKEEQCLLENRICPRDLTVC
jgi:hypothetical protein